MTSKKILSSFAVIAMALGLAGCTTINNTTSTSKKPEQATSSKVVNNNHKKSSSQQKISESSSSVANEQGTAPSAQNTKALSAATTNQNSSLTTNSSQKVNSNSTQKATNDNTNNESTVLKSFLKANNMQPTSTNNYVVTDLGSNNYQVEIRTNNNDNSVSHLDGLYKYNSQTNQTQQFNSVTGEWK